MHIASSKLFFAFSKYFLSQISKNFVYLTHKVKNDIFIQSVTHTLQSHTTHIIHTLDSTVMLQTQTCSTYVCKTGSNTAEK